MSLHRVEQQGIMHRVMHDASYEKQYNSSLEYWKQTIERESKRDATHLPKWLNDTNPTRKPKGSKERLTFARPVGKGGIILKAVGRLSNLNLFMTKDAPAGAKGRIECFKLKCSCGTTNAFCLELWLSTFSGDLFLSTSLLPVAKPQQY